MRNHRGVSASKASNVKAEVKAFRIGDRSAVHEKNDDKNTVDKEETNSEISNKPNRLLKRFNWKHQLLLLDHVCRKQD